MDLARWQLFVQISEHGSLTRAATSLDTAQPVVSRQLRALETECGGRLFDRTGRGVLLTDLGRQILPRVTAWLAEAELISDEVRSSAGVATGSVTLGILGSIVDPLVPKLVAYVRKELPRVRLHVLEATSGHLEQWLADGHIDLAVVFRGERHRVDQTALASAEFHLIGPTGDAITSAAVVPFSKLADLPLILPGKPNGARVQLDQLARHHHIRLTVTTEVDSLAIQKSLVGAGLGYAILIRAGVDREVKAGTLQAARIVRPRVPRAIVLAASSHRPQTPAMREISRAIREITGQLVRENKLQSAGPRAMQD